MYPCLVSMFSSIETGLAQICESSSRAEKKKKTTWHVTYYHQFDHRKRNLGNRLPATNLLKGVGAWSNLSQLVLLSVVYMAALIR